MDKHEKKMDSSIWMGESMCQTARRPRKGYFKKTINQWT